MITKTPTAYMYRAALYHPDCMVEQYASDYPRDAAYVDVDPGMPEHTLNRLANNIEDLDREDEYTFDSGIFPKRVDRDHLLPPGSDEGYGDGENHGDYCDRCHAPLVGKG